MGPARRGFTLIEMLVVMIVIGILAGLAYARVQSQKDKAVIAAMTSDLRVLAEAQEAHYLQNRLYTTDLVSLNVLPTVGNSLVIVEATAAGWSGRISNPRTPRQCYILVGQAAPIGSATQDGVINCS